MAENYCTFLPDSVYLGSFAYDISGICYLHDNFYSSGEISRLEADKIMFSMLMNIYPEYILIWRIVYQAIRRFGWIFWYLHRIKNITRFEIKFLRAYGKAKVKNEIQLAMNRYGTSALA